jgi:HK97 family phage prohead protease
MLRVPERLALEFGASGVEMRAKANGTGGTKFQFNGYAAVYNYLFPMWDFWGDEFDEEVAPWAGQRTLANGCDVPFLVGHNDAGIPMARTKSGTMQLGEDSHGLHVNAPDLDGSVEQVRQLASAVERGDMDEMSMAFMVMRQDWSPDYTKRTILEYDLHKGDVSVVVFGANDGTAGSSMVALPAEQLQARRPTGVRQRGRGEQRMPTQPYSAHDGETNECPQCHSVNDDTAEFCDQCGTQMQPAGRVSNMQGVEDMIQACSCGRWNSGDAKFCGGCGSDLASSSGSGSYLWWKNGKPHEKRIHGSGDFEADTTDGPDYDPGDHAAPGHLKCPYTKASGCGLLNSPDAKFCDQCGGALYDDDGKIVADDSGVPEELEGDDSEALAHRRREIEFLALARPA